MQFMKKDWPFIGAVGIAAAIGLYAYINRGLFYEKPETEEFVEEEIEYKEELPEEEEIPAPYTTEKTEEKKQIKEKQYSSKDTKTKTKLRNRPLNFPSLPEHSGLEEIVEDEERPWYDLPAEKREFKTWEELGNYFNAALDAKDYKVAESYMQYAEQFVEPKTTQNIEDQKKAITHVIISRYNEFLNEIIGNCKNQDYDSLFRKVMWMNFFATEHEQAFPIVDPETRKDLNLTVLYQKGNQALESVEYCPN